MDVEKNGGRLFGRPKLTLSFSAEGKEGSPFRVRENAPRINNLSQNITQS
jgi:hypothetical protein